MRAHCLQHVPFEGPAYIESWLKTRGCDLTRTRFFESPDLPDAGDVDFLVIMGGPMSVLDEGAFPWLVSEKRFVRDVIEAGTPVLGVCLGAQIIANAMGAAVFPNPEKEIGWFPIEAVPVVNASAPIFRFPEQETVFHWHGETFDLPPGAVLLARSEACEHQAFQLGARVIGLQFHLETTPESVASMVAHGSAELVPSKYVQTGEQILAADEERYRTINRLMGDLLTFLLR